MIEQKITDLIASIDANTKALIALAGGKPAVKLSGDTKPGIAKKSGKTEDDLAAELLAKLAAETAAKDAAEDAGPTKEQVAKAIEQCLKAGKKAELIALLKTFKGAANATAVFAQGPEVSAQFIEGAEALCLGE